MQQAEPCLFLHFATLVVILFLSRSVCCHPALSALESENSGSESSGTFCTKQVVQEIFRAPYLVSQASSWETDSSCLHSGSDTSLLLDLGQVAQPLWAAVYLIPLYCVSPPVMQG